MNNDTAMRFYNLRKAHSLSQEELAEKIGVSRQSVSKWERGEASPDTDNLIALADIYNISLDELIRGDVSSAPRSNSSESDHVSFCNGIHVNSQNGEEVHISWDGVHVDTDDTHVHIGKSGVAVSDHEGNHIFPKEKISKTHHFFRAFPYPILVTLAYLMFGLLNVGGGWSLGWLIFLTIPLYYTLVESIFMKNGKIFAYPVLVTLIYLYGGLYFNQWHPLWIIFLTIPLYYFIFEMLKKDLKSKKDSQQ